MKNCIETMPLILPREQEIKVRGVHYKVGDTVWVPAVDSRQKGKKVRCPCCGSFGMYYFGEWSTVCSKVKEIRIVLKGTVPEVTYLLEEGGIRDAAHVFPTSAGAERWARAKAARDDVESQKACDKAKARIKKFIEKTREK
jgi:hypothetical protein